MNHKRKLKELEEKIENSKGVQVQQLHSQLVDLKIEMGVYVK